MFESKTPQQIIDKINALCDEDGYNTISTAQLIDWINEDLGLLHQKCVATNRDAYTTFTTGKPPAGTQTLTMVGSGTGKLNLSDFGFPRGVDYDPGSGNYQRMKPLAFVNRNNPGRMGYRWMGETVWVFPLEYASQFTLRIWYTTKAPVTSSSALSTAFSIIAGGDVYVSAGVAAKVRGRKDESPKQELELQETTWETIRKTLQQMAGDQRVIPNVQGSPWGDEY